MTSKMNHSASLLQKTPENSQVYNTINGRGSANSDCPVLSPVVPHFAREVEEAVNALSSRPPGYVDENEFIDASRLVYDGVREIRRAVLMNRVWKTFYILLPQGDK